MSNTILDVTYEGGMKVAATIRNFTVHTDQKEKQGGEDSAPTPFELFFAALATCAGVYAKRFCDKKNISVDGIAISMECEFDPDPKKYRAQKITTSITVPADFPENFETALIRTVEGCAVKKQILEPPVFEVRIQR
ncbi:OsmC family protein [Desulfovibrio mangrovi]|uniref:OsmC family protein n=1 Tax=Desulfovibrio mangrovi TaxID=2976983 RepID=UPI0022455C2B|nr:OsmC family protein [Desulfovibrio mangrovi]UZP68704.1 OsmC family protein [Desulfovibrio mangrovi]